MESWKIQKTEIRANSILHYRILEQEKEITFREFLCRLQADAAFRKFYNSVISDCCFHAFFWEHPPITNNTIDDIYEFVLIDSPFLSKVPPDINSFKNYFKNNMMVADFLNLGGDAWLIAPAQIAESKVYTHIGNFVRNAPMDQIDAFWKCIGDKLGEFDGKEKKWLSTSGLGVYWLHARIDSYPKYYQYEKYRQM